VTEPFSVVYAKEAADDLRRMRAFDQRRILDGIYAHLRHEPQRASRSRIKQMIQPFWSEYRLRMGDFRVYYDVDTQSRRVHVLRVLKKFSGTTPKESP
jgi:mRNA interferase RelE/StbE